MPCLSVSQAPRRAAARGACARAPWGFRLASVDSGVVQFAFFEPVVIFSAQYALSRGSPHETLFALVCPMVLSRTCPAGVRWYCVGVPGLSASTGTAFGWTFARPMARTMACRADLGRSTWGRQIWCPAGRITNRGACCRRAELCVSEEEEAGMRHHYCGPQLARARLYFQVVSWSWLRRIHLVAT